LQAAEAEAEAEVLQHEDSNHDLESDLFKVRGILETESEYVKWMKQQPMKRDTVIPRRGSDQRVCLRHIYGVRRVQIILSTVVFWRSWQVCKPNRTCYRY
jgi:hypothetical protein